jgi:hypothetical protein
MLPLAVHQSIFSLINAEMNEEHDNMSTMHDDWTEIIKLAQALMPERPTTALNRFMCNEGERASQAQTDGGSSPK